MQRRNFISGAAASLVTVGLATPANAQLGGLGGLIGGLGGGGLLESVLGGGPTDTGKGNDILGNIFGGKETSRGVASEVSAITGIDENLLKKMLPILAMAVAGYMAKQATGGGQSQPGGGALGGILGSIIGGLASR